VCGSHDSRFLPSCRAVVGRMQSVQVRELMTAITRYSAVVERAHSQYGKLLSLPSPRARAFSSRSDSRCGLPAAVSVQLLELVPLPLPPTHRCADRSTPRLLRSYASFIENIMQRPAAAREFYNSGPPAAGRMHA